MKAEVHFHKAQNNFFSIQNFCIPIHASECRNINDLFVVEVHLY